MCASLYRNVHVPVCMYLFAPCNDHEVNVTNLGDDASSYQVLNIASIPAMKVAVSLTVRYTARCIAIVFG